MLRRIWAIVRKEFTQTLRDKSTLAMLIATPMLQLLLLGFAIDMNVDHISTVIADQSLDAASRAYVEAMASSSYFDVIEHVSGQAEVVRALDEGRAQAGIVIPPDFAANVTRGQAQVLFLVDGSDLFTTQSAYNAAIVIAQKHAAELMVDQVARAGLPFSGEPPLEARHRILYNPDVNQMWFAIPGLASMILQTQSIAITALAVIREREMGTIEQLLVTPIRPLELMLGKIAPNIVIAMLNMTTVVALGVFGFGVPFQGSFGLFFGLSFLYVFSGLGLGLLISTISKNINQTIQLIMALTLLGVVLGGYIFPRYTMPPFLYALGYLFPLSYFITIARGVISKGVGLHMLWGSVLPMIGYSVLVMFIAARSFKQGLD